MVAERNPVRTQAVALYHAILAHEPLNTASAMLLAIVQKAQREHPSAPRILVLDIDGHCSASGSYFPEVHIYVAEFVRGFLGPLCAEVTAVGSTLKNPAPQCDTIPTELPEQFR